MKKIIFLVPLLLAGCDARDPYWEGKPPLSNEKIVQAENYCHDHKMLFWQWDNSHGETVAVQCYIGNRTDNQ